VILKPRGFLRRLHLRALLGFVLGLCHAVCCVYHCLLPTRSGGLSVVID
jgi:hypothetical protein